MPTPTSRRAVLAGGAGIGAAALAAAATGCGLARGDGTTTTGAVDPSAPAVDTDTDLVETVAEHLATTLALAGAVGAAHRGLRPLSRRLAALHRAHLEQLGRSDDGRGDTVRGSSAAARTRLLRAEEQLQQRLVRAALDAESGALAQVFASMAAAVAQQRAVA